MTLLGCPVCRRPWGEGLVCVCGHAARRAGDVLDLFVSGPDGTEAVTETVRGFYEERPFPDYRDTDDRGALLRRGRASGFTRALDDELPPTARVVELGCGTGQLGLFLAAAGRPVLGVDLTQASLDVAEAFRQKAGLHTARLVRGNLFAPPVVPQSADVVICSGVLHHTGDPERGFRSAVSLVRPGGVVVVGLYNRLGRLLLPLLKRRHRAEAASGRRGLAWYTDQHEHPHESTHTVDEVLGWFSRAGVAFVSARPGIVPGVAEGHLFSPSDPGFRFGRVVAQLGWLGRATDGGLFVMVGRVPG